MHAKNLGYTLSIIYVFQKEEEETPTTLDVPSHQLRPALEGEEITYIADHKTESDTNTQLPEQT